MPGVDYSPLHRGRKIKIESTLGEPLFDYTAGYATGTTIQDSTQGFVIKHPDSLDPFFLDVCTLTTTVACMSVRRRTAQSCRLVRIGALEYCLTRHCPASCLDIILYAGPLYAFVEHFCSGC